MEMKHPRVLFVLPSLISSGGAEQLVYRMIQRMLKNQLRPAVCCLDHVGDLGAQLEQAGIKVYCRQQRYPYDIGLILWLRTIIKEEQIDVVHAHMYAAFEYSVPAAFISGTAKVIYTVHGRLHPECKPWTRRLLYPLWSAAAAQLVSISKKTKDAMVQYDFHPEKKIRVIYNGIEFKPAGDAMALQAMRASLGIKEQQHIVGAVARLEDIKNIPMMFRAIKRVLAEYPETYLLLAGEGSKLDSLQQYAQELGIAGRVIFLGQRHDLHIIYPLFDVFLLSSFTEGVSVSLLEAMSYGIPAVATDVGGNPEVVEAGETGFLVPSDDDAAMAANILELLNSKKLADKLGENGKKRVEQHFSFDGMMSEYMELYHSLSA